VGKEMVGKEMVGGRSSKREGWRVEEGEQRVRLTVGQFAGQV